MACCLLTVDSRACSVPILHTPSRVGLSFVLFLHGSHEGSFEVGDTRQKYVRRLIAASSPKPRDVLPFVLEFAVAMLLALNDPQSLAERSH